MTSASAPAIDAMKALRRQGRLVPFVGAGFSQSLGLPTWRDLMEFVGRELGYDPDVLLSQGTFEQIAEFYLLKNNGRIGALRAKMERWFDESKIDISRSRQHVLLAQLGAPVIYTTNYDALIEMACKEVKIPFRTIVSLDDMVRDSSAATTIVKFHGGFTNDESLVISESHYFSRMSLEGAIDLKLRHDLLGSALLFLGYGFQDMNLRYMWYRLRQLWQTGGGLNKEQLPSYYAGLGINDVQRTILRVNYNIECLDLAPDNPEASMEALLASLME